MTSTATTAVGKWRRSHPQVFRAARLRRRRAVVGSALFAVAFMYSLWALEFSAQRLLDGLQRLDFLLPFMWPPSSGGEFATLFVALLETLAMAFLGTLGASVVAFGVGFCAARNVLTVAPLYFSVRRVLDIIRAIDSMIWALVFVRIVGLGPFAGVLAIFVSDLGTLSKIYGEAIEAVDRRQVDAVAAAGAGRLERLRFGVLPQVAPVMLSNSLYFLEANTRSATLLGVVGAGGIGFHLTDRIRANAWDEVSFIIVMLLVAVAAIDWLSHRLRRALT